MNRAGLDQIEAHSLDQVRGACVYPLVAEEHREAFRALVRDVFRGEARTMEFKIIGLKGRPLWLNTSAVPLRDGAGEIVSLLAVTDDITARKEAEEKLRRSEEFVRSILDAVDEGFVVIDRDYRLVTVNKAYCDQVGLAAEALTGRRCHEITHRSSRACFEICEECAVRQVFATGRPAQAVHRHPDAAGGTFSVETKAFPLRDAEGHVRAAIQTVTDISERHLLEQERLKTQKLASIGTLAGGIAHDFNNLLQGIFGYISMARMNIDRKERSLALLAEAERALQQSVNLTSQLLTFSKGGRPVKARIALGPVIEDAARFALSGSRSEYRLEVDPELWPVDADAGQIGQVVQNIVLNADQAMPLGGCVTISARNLPADRAATLPGVAGKDHVEIAIRDQGIGIPAQFLDKIFDPYFTTKEKGSGLGLATSYSIIRNHDGRIEVKTTPGQGSTFVIRIPASPGPTGAPARPAAPAGGRTGRVLVMDDEEVVRTVVGNLVQALGHEADVAEHGEAALEKFQAARAAGRPFDIVILDLTVRGGMGGAETMRKLLEIDPDVKAVVSSGYSDDAVTSSYREHGFRSFLKKPFQIGELRQILDTMLA